MANVPFRTIEETFLTVEKEYGLELTDGLFCFLTNVYTNIFQNDKLRSWRHSSWQLFCNTPSDNDTFCKEFFLPAIEKELPIYQNGALEKICKEKNIDLAGVMDEIFRKNLEKQKDRNSDYYYEEEPDKYASDCDTEDGLIRKAQWQVLQWAARNYDNDTEGFCYFGERMILSGSLHSRLAPSRTPFYVMEIAANGRDSHYDPLHYRLYIRAELFDGMFRELLKSCGKISDLNGRYLNQFIGVEKINALKDEFDRLYQKSQTKEFPYHSMGDAYAQIDYDICGRIKRFLEYIISDYGPKEDDVFVIYGPYCISEEGAPAHMRIEEKKQIEIEFGSDHEVFQKYMGCTIKLKAGPGELLDTLDGILKNNASCLGDKAERNTPYYYKIDYKIGQEKNTFEIDYHVMIDALIEHYAESIEEICTNYVGYYYTMNDIKYLGKFSYYSDHVLVREFYDTSGKSLSIFNCRFYNLFSMPLRRSAYLQEGTIGLDNGCRMLCQFRQLSTSGVYEEKAVYQGTLQIFNADGERIHAVKGKYLGWNSSTGVIPRCDYKTHIILRGLYFTHFFLMELLELEEYNCVAGNEVKDRSYLFSSTHGREIGYEPGALAYRPGGIDYFKRALNDFVCWRREGHDVWDEIIDFTEKEFGGVKKEYELYYKEDDQFPEKTEFGLRCIFDQNGGEIIFLLNHYDFIRKQPADSVLPEECIREAEFIVPVAEKSVRIHFHFPYCYGYKSSYIKLAPTEIRVEKADSGKKFFAMSVYEDKEFDKLYELEEYFLNWSLMDFLEKPGKEKKTSEKILGLYSYLYDVHEKLPKTQESSSQSLYDRVAKILARDVTYHINENVIRSVCYEMADFLCWKYKRDRYTGTGCPALPNLAFMGSPGSGKSRLIRKLARDVIGAKFLETTPSDLKGLFVGHTRGVFLDKIDQLQSQPGQGPDTPAILFLDEAYTLFSKDGRQDSFQQEIIELLLTIMQHRDHTISYKIEKYVDGEKISEEKTIVIRANTVVWMAGYEKEMRKALSANAGLFRRVATIVLPDPKMDELWKRFHDVIQEAEKEDLKLVESKKKEIIHYFRWGSTKEHAEFFGNYSGARKLAENMLNTLLLLDENASPELKEQELNYVIDAQKKEIRRQYQNVISNDERLPFEVISDLDENLDHYIGSENLKEQMREIVDMMVNVEEYKKRHVDIPKGALLKGFPGTGKTYLARCMAGELAKSLQEINSPKNIAFIPVASTELRNEELVSALFSAAEEYEAAVIFIDEIDAIGKKRHLLNNPNPLLQLMKEMDGFDDRKAIFVLAATNAPEILDDALKRAGRFDMQFEIGYPSSSERMDLIRFYARETLPRIQKKFLEEASKATYGLTPADIKEVLNEAALLYYRCEKKLAVLDEKPEQELDQEIMTICMHRRVGKDKTFLRAKQKEDIQQDLFLLDLKEVITKKKMGERLSSTDLDETFQTEENTGYSSVAIHEIGHALVYLWQNCHIEKITVLKRNTASGYVEGSFKQLRTKGEYLKRIRIAFGGRAAEELFYGDDISDGASDDLRTATEYARIMVTQFGMGNGIGVMSLGKDTGRYLGTDFTYTCSEDYIRKADEEVQAILQEEYAAVREYLGQHKSELRRLAEYVFEKEEISGDEFQKKWKELANL